MFIFKKPVMKKLINYSLIILLLFSLISIYDIETYAQGTDLARIAASNNYSEYQNGTTVDNSLGNMTAYDVYVLEKEGADTSLWEREGTDLKAETLELIDENRSGAAIDGKALTQTYLAAKEYCEIGRADSLLSKIQDQQDVTTGVFGFGDIFVNMPVYDMLCKIGALSEIDLVACKNYVMIEQNIEDSAGDVYGAWGAFGWVEVSSGDWQQTGPWAPDFISSIQGVRVLQYLYDITSDNEINNRKNIGLNWLLKQQQADGSFAVGAWDDAVTNTAEMIITLDLLGMRDSKVWDDAVNYLQNHALNDDGEFGNYGGIGNNTLILEAYHLINEAPLASETVIDMVIYPSDVEMEIGDEYRCNLRVCRFGSGLDDLNPELVNWSIASNGNVASIDGTGKITGKAKGTAIVTAEFSSIKRLVEVTVEGGSNSGEIEERPSYIRITLYISGIDDEIIFADVLKLRDEEEDGFTVMDALDAGDIGYKCRGSYVYEINGLEEKETTGLAGWKYKVNNSIKSVSADNCYLDDKDVVIWFYADGPSDRGPTLNSLIENASKSEEELEEVKDINKSKEKDEKMLSDSINRHGKAILDIEKNPGSKAYLSPGTLKSLSEKEMNLTIKNQDISVEFGSASISKQVLHDGMNAENTYVQIKVNIITEEEKEKLLKKADQERMKSLFDIGGRLVDLSVHIIHTDDKGNIEEEEINNFIEPVKVSISIPEGLNMKELENISAIRYETDEEGNIAPVKIGGSYDAETGAFIFYTEHFSYYGVMRAEQLKKIRLQIDSPMVTVDGEEKNLDVPPMIIDSRTMVPVRFISESLGADVQWVAEERKVIIIADNRQIVLEIGEIPEGSDAAPIIKDSRALMPVRYVSEKLDASVLWIPSSRSVEIIQ